MNLMNSEQSETALESGGFGKGVAVAIVTQNQDDAGMGRVKVRYPWHHEPRESYWARLATPMAGKDRGLVTIPEIGDEVLVAFEREDLRFPYVLGALWNGQDTPPYANEDGNNDKRMFKSRKGHLLSFDDGSQGVVELAHENGGHVRLTDDGIEVEDGNGNRFTVDNRSGAMKLSTSGSLEIKAASVTIEATGTMELKANATLTVRGALVNIN